MLERVALITALLGTLLLVFLSQELEPKPTEISEISHNMLEQWVKVNGIIVRVKETNGLIIIDLVSNNERDSITIIAYKNKAQIGSIEKGLQVEVIGKVIEYYGKLEIEATKIKLL
jgi:RecJ-like exonuclease